MLYVYNLGVFWFIVLRGAACPSSPQADHGGCGGIAGRRMPSPALVSSDSEKHEIYSLGIANGRWRVPAKTTMHCLGY